MTRKLTVAALCALMAVAGCSSEGEDRANPILTSSKQVFSAIKANRASDGPAPYIQVTREQLENTKVAALQVNVLSRGGSDILRRIAQRNDGGPGQVAVWRGSDGSQLFLRDGVLTGTRGIGGDIISADAAGTIAAVRGARSGNGERRYFVSNGDYSDTEVVLSCDIENLGRETTNIVHLSYPTVHLQETCIGGAKDRVRIVNDYWVRPSNGTVLRSKQWVGPLSGYFELILLRN